MLSFGIKTKIGTGMAEEENLEEEIVIIEDDELPKLEDKESNSNESNDEDEDEDEEKKKQKKLILIAGIVIIVVLVIAIVTVVLIKNSEDDTKPIPMDAIEEKLDKKTLPKIQPSKLENLIAKANYLYSTGSKQKALKLYERIAMYSEAISLYNLGVSQLKNKQYETALNTFSKAIQNDEKRCVSAINAAVCALYIGDKESFRYNIDLAYAYLPQEIDSPLYSYYYTLINYYNKDYYEALSALKNPTSDYYNEQQKHLNAKINALYDNNYAAIESMEKNLNTKDYFSIALLYARIGDITLAISNLENAISHNIEPLKAQLALGLLKLKAGRIQSGADDINKVTLKYEDEVYKPYPIKVSLKKSLFDPVSAQELYRGKIQNSRSINYQKLFYFSPYKVFNANKNISYIRKGTANVYIDNIASAQDYLKKSASSSKVNKGIAKAINKALKFRIREANKELLKLVKIYPKHSILQYNLALTYAQMGNMIEANKHFLYSYHLDAKNYLSGIYAVMTSQLINKDYTKLKAILKDNLSLEDESEELDFYHTLLRLSSDNILSAIQWLNNTYKPRPIYLAMSTILSIELNKFDYAKKASKELVSLLPNDILPHLMYIDAHFDNYDKATYAKKVISYLKKQKFHFNDFYYGAYVTRYLYIQENLITGQLYFLSQQLKDVLQSGTGNREDIINALALTSLYDGSAEEAYTLYNQLIDDLKVRDAYTLFMGAVASISAKHPANAIALLELSKMKNPDFYESRYALGLLYLEVEKNKNAVIEFSKIHKNGFKSEYFNFDINLGKLLFEKEHKELRLE